jgi:hypothetical protein
VQVMAVLALGAAYLVSAYLPRQHPGTHSGDLLADAANYAGFFLAALAAAALSRRWLGLIGQRNTEAARGAAELSHDAQRQAAADVFGPVLDLLDDLQRTGDEVPEVMRTQAGRLITLIAMVKPRRHQPVTGVPAGGDGGADRGSLG